MREYQLRRSNRKTLSLEITEELAVLVRAPQHTPPERIERFVQEHEGWIETQMERCRQWKAAHPEPTEEEVREALAGNYCRCGTHYTAVESIMAYVDQNRKKREEQV